MADETTRGPFLKRWSQRKHAAAREAVTPPAPATVAPPAAALPATAGPPATAPAAEAATAALPPVESLTFDADFTAFMKGDVDPLLRRDALKKLFTDPRFNVMDGLDVYIDDYSKFEPLDAETAKSLVSARYIFDPPKTRVNDQGVVEDVPPEEEEAKADADAVEPAALPPPQAEAVPAPAPPVDAEPVALERGDDATDETR